MAPALLRSGHGAHVPAVLQRSGWLPFRVPDSHGFSLSFPVSHTLTPWVSGESCPLWGRRPGSLAALLYADEWA